MKPIVLYAMYEGGGIPPLPLVHSEFFFLLIQGLSVVQVDSSKGFINTEPES